MRTIVARLVPLSVSIPLLLCASQALAADGAALYKEKCSGCHGVDGKADTAAAKAMKVPALAGKGIAPEDVVKHLRTSEKHKAMASKLSDEELSAIASALPR
jgi:mono/diheme cytochrome c family protein